MPFLAACPFCRRKVQAPETALGQSIACKKCHNFFTLAPEDDLPPPEATARNAQEYLIAARANALNPPPAQAAPTSMAQPAVHVDTVVHAAMKTLPETPRLRQPLQPQLDEPDSADEISLWMAAPLVLGLIALLCAAMGWLPWLTIALGGVGVLAGVIAWLTAAIQSHRDGVLVLLGGAVSAIALVWALM